MENYINEQKWKEEKQESFIHNSNNLSERKNLDATLDECIQPNELPPSSVRIPQEIIGGSTMKQRNKILDRDAKDKNLLTNFLSEEKNNQPLDNTTNLSGKIFFGS